LFVAPTPAWSAADEQRYQAALQRLRLGAQQLGVRLQQQLVAQRVRALLATAQQAAADGADPLLLLCAAARLIERAQLWREQQQQQLAAAPQGLQHLFASPQQVLGSEAHHPPAQPPAKRMRVGAPPRPN
jgi:hypothetical protein